MSSIAFLLFIKATSNPIIKPPFNTYDASITPKSSSHAIFGEGIFFIIDVLLRRHILWMDFSVDGMFVNAYTLSFVSRSFILCMTSLIISANLVCCFEVNSLHNLVNFICKSMSTEERFTHLSSENRLSCDIATRYCRAVSLFKCFMNSL